MQNINYFIGSRLNLNDTNNIYEKKILKQLNENPEKLHQIFSEIVNNQELLKNVSLHFKIKLVNLMNNLSSNPNQIRNSAEKVSNATKSIRVGILDLESNTVKIKFEKQDGSYEYRDVSKYLLASIDQRYLENNCKPEECLITIQDKVYDFFTTDQDINFAGLSPIEIQEIFTFAGVFEFDINKMLHSIEFKDIKEENIGLLLQFSDIPEHTHLKNCCFKFIKDASGIDLTIDDLKVVNATIADFADLECIKKHLDFLPSSKLAIAMKPAKGQELSKLEEFSSSFADIIMSLDLIEMANGIDDSVIEKLSKKLININSISVKSDNITDHSVDYINNFTKLTILVLSECKTVTTVNVSNLTNLTTLRLSGCEALTTIDGLGYLTNLTTLDLSCCEALTEVNELGNLTNLTTLDLSYCEALTALDGLHNLTNLTTLALPGCNALTTIDGLANLTNLTTLTLSGCNALTTIDGLANLTNLKTLTLSGCNVLKALNSLNNFTKLTTLHLSECSNLTAVDEIGNLTKLSTLHIRSCKALTKIDALNNLTNLTSLTLSWCSILTAVDLSKLTNLNFLDIHGSSSLKTVDGLGKLTNLTSLNFSCCKALNQFDLLKSFILFMSHRDIKDFNSYKTMFGLVHLKTKYITTTILEENSLVLKNKYLELLNTVKSENDLVKILEFMCLIPKKGLKIECISNLLKNSGNENFIKNSIKTFAVKYINEINQVLANPTPFQFLVAYRLNLHMLNIMPLIVFLERYLSKKIKTPDTFILEDTFLTYLNDQKNENQIKKILTKYRDKIHSECTSLSKFIKQKFPESDHPSLYPIRIFSLFNRLSINLNWYHLKNNNLEIFEKLARHISKTNINSTSVRFNGEKGIDGGALSRQLFSQLVSDFVRHAALSTEIPSKYDESLKHFGVVIGLIHKLNTQILIPSRPPLHTGCGMAEEIYRGMLEFSYKELHNDFNQISAKRQIEIYRALLSQSIARYEELDLAEKMSDKAKRKEGVDALLNFISWDGTDTFREQNLKFLQSEIDLYYLTNNELQNVSSAHLSESDTDEVNFEAIQKNLADWQKFFKENPFETRLYSVPFELANLHAIASGMKYSENQWEEIQNNGALALQINIEGKFSRDKFLQSFDFDAMLPGEFMPKFEKWSQTLSDNELKRFLSYMTGSPTIPWKKIVFEIVRSGVLDIHACASLVHVNLEGITAIVNGMNSANQEQWTVVDFIIHDLNKIAKGKKHIQFEIG